jgi:hypothetical protein
MFVVAHILHTSFTFFDPNYHVISYFNSEYATSAVVVLNKQ